MNIWRTFKLDKWWNYKIGGALFTFFLLKSITASEWTFSSSDFALFSVFFLLILLGFSINDYSDFEHDRKAGKDNLFNVIPIRFAPAYLGALAFISVVLCVSFLREEVIIMLFALMLLNYVYSAKPFRLKESKYLSIIVTGLYERALFYAIVIVQALSSAVQVKNILLFISIYLAWSFVWEVRNYINGQMRDTEMDRKSGVITIVSFWGIETLNSFKKRLILAEIFFLFWWIFIVLSIQSNFSIIFISAALIVFIHFVLQGKSIALLSSAENILDYSYNYAFIASVIIYKMIYGRYLWLIIGVVLLILFSSDYAKNSFIKFFVILRRIISRIYFFVFYIMSSIVNYSIYYFRKYILRWSENRSRGIDHRIVFLHIHKTAGTTFNNILSQLFSPENRFLIEYRRSDETAKRIQNIPQLSILEKQKIYEERNNMNDYINLSKSEKEKIYLLQGHMAFGIHTQMPGEVKYITFIREPRERIVSAYYYIRNNEGSSLNELIKKNNWTLYDFVLNMDMIELNNGQLKLISGIEDTEEVMMLAAMENIKNHFSFIGLTEYFEESLKRLEKIYGWKISNYVNYKVNESRPKLSDIDEKTMKLIEEKNHGDILFYEKIKAQFLYADKS